MEVLPLIQDICDLNNNVWDNKHGSYSDFTEDSMQMEEVLEGYDLNSFEDYFPDRFEEGSSPSAKEVAIFITNIAMNSGNEEINDVDRFDKHIDGIYVHIGALHKLGLTPDQMIRGLEVVHAANKQKSGTKDENGKVIKPEGFVEPEPQLQLILDERTI